MAPHRGLKKSMTVFALILEKTKLRREEEEEEDKNHEAKF
jgi:hypothetical protein